MIRYSYSPRVRGRFIQVVDAKRFENVFLCKKYAEIKNQSRYMKYTQRITHGNSPNSVKMGVPL